MEKCALRVEKVSAGYGSTKIVDGVSLSVPLGAVATLVGPNGAGKSTLLKSLVGDSRVFSGHVFLDGTEVTGWPMERLVEGGLGYVPQVRDVFETLSVEENLEMGTFTLGRREARARIGEILDRFELLRPLRGRRAADLSGGERKLLGVARALLLRPHILLLDEPTAGLSEAWADRILRREVPLLAESGVGVLLVEQRALEAVAVSDTVHVLVDGRLSIAAPGREALSEDELMRAFLGAP